MSCPSVDDGPGRADAELESLERRARRSVEQAIARAREEARPQWVALSAPAPAGRDALAGFARAVDRDRFYWENPAEGWTLLALGEVACIEVEGSERFGRAGDFARSVFERVSGASDCDGPWLVGGFAFEDGSPSAAEWADFPAGRWVLPERMWLERDGRATAVVCTDVGVGDDVASVVALLLDRLHTLLAEPAAPVSPPKPPATSDFQTGAELTQDDYRHGVAEALERIEAGELEKVVLARSVRVRSASPIAVASLLGSLRDAYPSCVIFAVSRADSTFLGATPERLVSVDGATGVVRTGAVAGSAPRGHTPSEDLRLARALADSPKEQAEHAAVVRAVRDALRPVCGELSGPESPGRLALEGIQHLETPLEGRVDEQDRKSTGLLELGGALHPTPAVGGAPVERARRFIRERETLERGWYASPVGFVDRSGGGELRVALRSALVRANQAVLYAGAGIVAGSQPERELRETRLKLRSLLVPLLEV